MTRRCFCIPVSRRVRNTNTASARATAIAVNRNTNVLVASNEEETEPVLTGADSDVEDGRTTSPEELLSSLFNRNNEENSAEAEGRAIVRNNNINVVVNVSV